MLEEEKQEIDSLDNAVESGLFDYSLGTQLEYNDRRREKIGRKLVEQEDEIYFGMYEEYILEL